MLQPAQGQGSTTACNLVFSFQFLLGSCHCAITPTGSQSSWLDGQWSRHRQPLRRTIATTADLQDDFPTSEAQDAFADFQEPRLLEFGGMTLQTTASIRASCIMRSQARCWFERLSVGPFTCRQRARLSESPAAVHRQALRRSEEVEGVRGVGGSSG